jgi:hypothetical protein
MHNHYIDRMEIQTFELPDIYLKYRDASFGQRDISHTPKKIHNHANIGMKYQDPMCITDSGVYKNQYGYIIEYDKNTDTNEEILSVKVECDWCSGNYIIGDLLQSTYPNVKTVYLNRYRGYPNNVSHCSELQIDNLICYGSQGNVYALEYSKRIPNLKWLLFDVFDIYLSDEPSTPYLGQYPSMKEVNANPSMTNINQHTKLEGIMCLIDRFWGDDTTESGIVYDGYLDTDKTWTVYTATILIRTTSAGNKRFETWVIYRKNASLL